MGTLHEDLFTVMVSCWILLTMRNVSDKCCRENQNTHFMLKNFLQQLYHLWDNVEKYCKARQATDDNIMQHLRIVCWLNEATELHSEYIILTFFSTTNVKWMCLIVTLCVHCPSFGVHDAQVSVCMCTWKVTDAIWNYCYLTLCSS
jgi:hypothetical protein